MVCKHDNLHAYTPFVYYYSVSLFLLFLDTVFAVETGI